MNQEITIKYKVYCVLSVLFSVLIIASNLMYQKFVHLPLYFHVFELSVGAIMYPATFLITDLIAEFYGKKMAQFCVKIAIIMNIIVALLVIFYVKLEATSWSKISDQEFHKVFGMYSMSFLGSIMANYIAQSADIVFYLGIRKITGMKFMWIRNAGSSGLSLLIDTTCVVSFLVLFGILPQAQWSNLIWNSYSFKLFFTICNIPTFYLCVYIIKRLLRHVS